jgi:selenide, water dikinase
VAEVALTSLSHGAGCGCKLAADDLLPVVAGLELGDDPRLLVGAATADDAAVYRVDDELALVQTVDFFTPIVDDPYDFGRIAAANAISDIYAMGATPLTAMNIVAFPLERLGPHVLRAVLEGGLQTAREAGCTVVGGHSIDDAEPKYGMAVTGTVDPARMLTNDAARPGDVLVLSKPLGVGVLTTAHKRGLLEEGQLAEAVAVMSALNARASAAALAARARAATDVTGFGLLGHLYKLARASGVTAVISRAAVPFITGTRDRLRDGYLPGGSRRNLDWVAPHLAADGVSEDDLLLLADAQTSGGLLLAGEVPGAPVIGELIPRGPAVLVIR